MIIERRPKKDHSEYAKDKWRRVFNGVLTETRVNIVVKNLA